MSAGVQNPSEIEIRREEIAAAPSRALIHALNAELTLRYPEDGANHFRLDADEVTEGRGAFLIAYSNGQPMACGAIRRIDGARAEIKRMYVVPGARGKGLGGKMLAALEAEGRRLGAATIVLETGERQPEALALYTKAGFVRIPAFGEYVGCEYSVCMGKDL